METLVITSLVGAALYLYVTRPMPPPIDLTCESDCMCPVGYECIAPPKSNFKDPTIRKYCVKMNRNPYVAGKIPKYPDGFGLIPPMDGIFIQTQWTTCDECPDTRIKGIPNGLYYPNGPNNATAPCPNVRCMTNNDIVQSQSGLVSC